MPTTVPTLPEAQVPKPGLLLDWINATMSAISSLHMDAAIVVKSNKSTDATLLSMAIEADGRLTGNAMIFLKMDGSNSAFDGAFELEILQVDGIRYTRTPGIGEWNSGPVELDEGDPFEALMHGRLILEDLEVASETLNGAEVYRLSGSLPVAESNADLPRRGTVTMWVDVDGTIVRRMQVSEEIPASEYEGLIPGDLEEVFRSTDYELSRFHETVEISAPNLDAPLATPAPRPVAQQLQEGWTRYSTDEFEIDLPEDWIALEVSAEAVAALVQELQTSNPTFVPYVAALISQPEGELWAFDPASPPGISVNLSLRQEVERVPLDIYAEAMREQSTGTRFKLLSPKEYTGSSYRALILVIQGTAQFPDGESFDIEAQRVIIDDGENLYLVTLTYIPDLAEKYRPLFDAIVGTFRVVK